MSKVYKLDAPKGDEVFSYLVLSDIHSFDCDKVALKIALKAFKSIPKKQRRIILLGDILDFGAFYQKNDSFSTNLKAKNFEEFFIPEMESELYWFKSFHEEISKLTDKIIFVEGNHEQRLRRDKFVKSLPYAYAHNFDLKRQLNLIDSTMPFYYYNDWVRVGNIYLTHGMYCGSNPIKKHFDSIGTSVLFGHTHEIGIKSFSTVGKTRIGYNNPCLCSLQPDYLEGRVQNWSVGFSIITQTKHHTHCNVYNIWDGELSFGGKVYKNVL